MTSIAEAFGSIITETLPSMRSSFGIGMDGDSQRNAKEHELSITQVAWEDTGRTKGSCWGPNISDMTLVVNDRNQPIIRKPNFADLTSDQDIDSFNVNVGNENNSNLTSIKFREYLENIQKYTDVKVDGTLYDKRDDKILVSAQACVLPLEDGSTEFAVKLYNYQSCLEPAVLVVIASAQGTSAHFVLGRDNTLDFNKNGKLAKFVAKRLKDDRKERGVALEGEMTEDEKLRNALLIFQIPLKRKMVPQRIFSDCDSLESCAGPTSYSSVSLNTTKGGCLPRGDRVFLDSSSHSSPAGMDHAIVSTSEGRGEYPSLSKYTIERDTSMPIRCTIQYYHVTDEKTINAENMAQIASEVTRHKPIGSLVVGGKTERPTEHTAPPVKQMFSSEKLFSFL